MNSQAVRQAFGRVIREPAFVAAAIVLLVAAIGLNASVRFMKLHFKKDPVPLARVLTQIPDRVGSWVQVMPDKAIDKEIQDVLGTDQYIFREYVNEQAAGRPALREEFARLDERISKETDPERKARAEEERDKLLGQIRRDHPEAVVNLSVTYYTGMVDTVAHVPDRCYVANGYEPSSYEEPTWAIARELPENQRPGFDAGKPSADVQVRFINFEDTSGRSKIKRSVAYFFQTNGEFVCSPLQVRRKLQSLFARHAYYAKVEAMTLMEDKDKAAGVITDFLASAMPEIVKSLPDWKQVAAQERN